MFIKFGDRRINLDLIKQFKPKEQSIETGVSSRVYYKIEFLYLDGEKDDISFSTKKERDIFDKC